MATLETSAKYGLTFLSFGYRAPHKGLPVRLVQKTSDVQENVAHGNNTEGGQAKQWSRGCIQ